MKLTESYRKKRRVLEIGRETAYLTFHTPHQHVTLRSISSIPRKRLKFIRLRCGLHMSHLVRCLKTISSISPEVRRTVH